ncbi:MAG TPA: hypothetical protein VFV50_02830, partial [Bdellovibrionales bacterium]|nr:hypothetical protein [Bdellovibrionales bacterium]
EAKLASGRSCKLNAQTRYDADVTPPQVVVAFRNSADHSFNSGEVSCRRPCSDKGEVNPEELPLNECIERHSVILHIESNEPGTAFFCRHVSGTWPSELSQGAHLCAALGVAENRSAAINGPSILEIKLPHLTDSGAPYRINVFAVDTANNASAAIADVRVYKPRCPDESGCPSTWKTWKIGGGFFCYPAHEVPPCVDTTCKDAQMVK